MPYYWSVQESEWASDALFHSCEALETTVDEPRDFKTFRPKESDTGGAKQWRHLRRGVADLHRHAEVCQAANNRSLESMAAVEAGEALEPLSEPLCRPVRWKHKRVRALNPLSAQDAALLSARAADTKKLIEAA